MNDIKVGEFVRVKNVKGNAIAKIIKYMGRDGGYKDPKMYLLDRYVRHDRDCIESDEIYESDIIKHSKNIIDVLEFGDRVEYKTNMYIKIGEVCDEKMMEEIRISKVISVLTHEQIEANLYRLEK